MIKSTMGWQCVLMANDVGWPSISVRHALLYPDVIDEHVPSTIALRFLCT